jgi:glycolate oxidase FAD binding subunit
MIRDIADIAALVGAENVLSGEDALRFAVSGVVPALVTAPGSREETARLVILARERGWALVPYGGGTQMGMGFPPRKLDLVLLTRRLNRVVDYQPDDMTVTVEPGLTLAELGKTLAARNQFLPLNPPLPQLATVGGTVAAAASGPWRAAFGAPRDWVIGCRVVGADGQEVRGGGQVVKNVAGYDLPKLYTGSFGTLGVITEVTFKVMPKPPVTVYCGLNPASPGEVEALLARVQSSDLQPTAVVLQYAPGSGDSAPAWPLLFEFMQVQEAIEWQVRRLSELAGDLRLERYQEETGPGLMEEVVNLPAGLPFLARIGTLSSRTAALAADVVDLCRKHDVPPLVRSFATTGQVYVSGSDETGREFALDLRALAEAAEASCVFPRLPPALGERVDPWGEPGPELGLMRGIKESLDLTGVFSPGRFVGGL